MFNNLLSCIFNDINDVLVYFNNAVKLGIVYVVIFMIINCIIYQISKKDDGSLKKDIFLRRFIYRLVLSSLFVMYFYVLCNIVYFSREPGSRIGIDMRLFSTWGTTGQEHAYVIENVILFIPFGFLLPGCLPKKMSLLTVVAGLLCSICIEYMQYRTGSGYCQLDDVVTNTLGTVVGYIFFVIINKICH